MSAEVRKVTHRYIKAECKFILQCITLNVPSCELLKKIMMRQNSATGICGEVREQIRTVLE